VQQEKKDADDICKGIVKWLVEVYDQDNETCDIATILTMVKNKEQ
jgi:oxepin-CoA hydrolase/3-oxo-5,6-dehydrosuberyl-CoA semialdehyde dehydrogenase